MYDNNTNVSEANTCLKRGEVTVKMLVKSSQEEAIEVKGVLDVRHQQDDQNTVQQVHTWSRGVK